jgi:hypothetical protein
MVETPYVYIISSPLGYQKVGWAYDVRDRIRELTTSHPEDLSVLAAWQHYRASEVESRAHFLLQKHHAKREWFKCDPDTVRACVELAIRDINSLIPRDTPDKTRKGFSVDVKTLDLPAKPSLTIWTIERDAFLRNAWSSGMFPTDILTGLNTLPGNPITLWQSVRDRVKRFGCKRPADYLQNYGRHVSPSAGWTVERDACLAEMYDTATDIGTILVMLNMLPGELIANTIVVRNRAKYKGYKRPVGFVAMSRKIAPSLRSGK